MAFLFCSPFNESNLTYSFKQSKNKTLPEEKENSFTTCLQRKMIPMLPCFWITQQTKEFKGLPQTWSCKTVQENKILWHLSLERTGSLPCSSFSISTWNGTTNSDLPYSCIPTHADFSDFGLRDLPSGHISGRFWEHLQNDCTMVFQLFKKLVLISKMFWLSV